MIRRTALALSLLLLPLSPAAAEELCVCRYCSGARRAALLDEPGKVAASRKYAPDVIVDVLNIKIDVTPNFDERTIKAETTIDFTPIAKPVDEITLDAVDLRIEEVTGSRGIKEYVASDEELTILFESPIEPGGRASVTVKYDAEPKQGLYFRTPELGYPEGDEHIWTQGEPHEARHWFPCFDYPNERSSTEVICRVPEEMTVLSNGKRVSESVDDQTGLKAVHWRQEKPHVAYLVCLAAGHFHKLEKHHGDLPLAFFTQPSLAEHAENSFRDTDKIIAFYEEEIGVPFPWAKYYQATVLDFIAGGMENTTLTLLTDRTIFTEATENIRSSRGLDAHETAHQWFGDYVTCEDWSHLWLNEGFATYYTHLYEGHKLGRDHLLYGLYRDARGRVLSTDDTRPIVYREYQGAWDQFDFRAYPKGSWVLHMLRSQLGEDIYREAIKNYLEKHALTSVVTPDLVAELEDASGRSLDLFFDQWVYHGGFPKLRVTYRWLPKEKLAHVSVAQTQETGDDVLLFTLPTKLRFINGDEHVDHEIEISETEHDFYVPLEEKPDVVRLDPEYTVLAQVDFNKPQEMLEAQLARNDDVIGRLMAAEALGEEENKKSVAALKKALNEDDFFGVRIAAADALGELHNDDAYEALTESTEQDDARVRQKVVQTIGDFYRPKTVDLLVDVVESEDNPEIVSSAIAALGKFQDEDARFAIRAAMRRSSFRNEIVVAAMRAAVDTADASLGPAMQGALAERAMFTDAGYGQGLTALAQLARDAEDQSAVRELIEEALSDPASRVRLSAVQALGELGDRGTIALLRTIAQSRDQRVARSARQAIERIEEDSPMVPDEVAQLRRLVRELQESHEELEETVEELKAKASASDEQDE